MTLNIITSLLIGLFTATFLRGMIKVAYNLKTKQPTHGSVWLVPSILAMAIWFCLHL